MVQMSTERRLRWLFLVPAVGDDDAVDPSSSPPSSCTLNGEERRNLSQWVGKMGKTLQAVSRDTPSFTPGNDASVGCLVENGS